ncbi:LysR family transcriptional regulator [Thalassospira povalilytica]|nr:LysR family transcriptional regulator [Thalassospira povalilytica]
MKKSHEMSRAGLMAKANQNAPLLAAIARENSFSKAAEILGVHQSAISHRVNLLEEALGFSLFERTTRQITPTAYGRILCVAAIEAMAVWDGAFDRLEKFENRGAVRLSVSSSLAMKWVLPHLGRAAEAGLEIALDVNDRPADFRAGVIDAAIRFGVGPYPGLHSTLLKRAEIMPVARPGYCEAGADLEMIAGLPSTTFLKDVAGERDDTDFSWAYYKDQAGLSIETDARHIAFDRADLVLQAAINGMGIGLGRTLLVEGDIAQGFLVPVGPSVVMKSAYWLVCGSDFAGTERYAMLLGWLKSQMK